MPEDSGPRPLSWSFRRLASRVARVDVLGLAAIEAVWSKVPSATPSGATPARLADGELVVSVPTGAHAARARRDAAAMLAELAAVVEVSPTRLRVTVRR